MKITLNELRQMVKNILVEMDVNYAFKLPYIEGLAWEDNEKFKAVDDMGRLKEVADAIDSKSDYTIIGSESTRNDSEFDSIVESFGAEVEEGKFPFDRGELSYSVYEHDDIYAIVAQYNKTLQKGLYYAENFIFYAN
jgi:hypothetical protein